MRQYNFPRPVYIKDLKDVPDRVRHHNWLRTIDLNKLPRVQLKVRMCCSKCEEKVLEEIWEVRGVFDVITSRMDEKVVVTAMPELPDGVYFDGFLDKDELLRKARKIDCRAKFVKLDHVDPAPPKQPQSSGGQQKSDVPKHPERPPRPSDVFPWGFHPCPPRPSSDGFWCGFHPCPPRPSDVFPCGFHPGPPPVFCRDPAHDNKTPFYFFLFIVLLLSLLIFRK